MKRIKYASLVVFAVPFIAVAIAALQGRGGPAGPQAPAPNLTFDRILKSNSEPQNWMTYSGSFMSQQGERP